MLEMVEQYERCYYLGAYTGQECELCPHRDECKEDKECTALTAKEYYGSITKKNK